MFRVLNPNWSLRLLFFSLSFFRETAFGVINTSAKHKFSENSHGEIRARVQRRDEIVQSSRHGFESSF